MNSVLMEISYHLLEIPANLAFTTPIFKSLSPQTITVSNTVGVYVGAQLLLDEDLGGEEIVTVISYVPNTSITAIFLRDHFTPAVVLTATFPSQAPTDAFFTQAEVLSYLSRAQNEFMAKVPCVFQLFQQNVPYGNIFQQAPSTMIEINRVAVSYANIALASLSRRGNIVTAESVSPHGLTGPLKFNIFGVDESTAPLYLVDSTGQVWLLGITDAGQRTTTPVTAPGVPFVLVKDSVTSQIWQVAINPLGEWTLTAVALGQAEPVILIVSPSGFTWQVSVASGQFVQTLNSPAPAFLTDSGGHVWQLGVTDAGERTATPAIAGQLGVPSLLLRDVITGQIWAVTISTIGEWQLTVAAGVPSAFIALISPSFFTWNVQVARGQFQQVFSPYAPPSPPVSFDGAFFGGPLAISPVPIYLTDSGGDVWLVGITDNGQRQVTQVFNQVGIPSISLLDTATAQVWQVTISTNGEWQLTLTSGPSLGSVSVISHGGFVYNIQVTNGQFVQTLVDTMFTVTWPQVGPDATADGGTLGLFVRLYETTQEEIALESRNWRNEYAIAPRRYFEDRAGNYGWGLSRKPSTNMTAELLVSIRDSETLSLTDGFLVPDIVLHGVKYLALSYIFSKDGEQQDMARARYCRQRAERVILAAQRWMGLPQFDQQRNEAQRKSA